MKLGMVRRFGRKRSGGSGGNGFQFRASLRWDEWEVGRRGNMSSIAKHGICSRNGLGKLGERVLRLGVIGVLL